MTPDIVVGQQVHLRGPEVAQHVMARHKAGEEISDACAATIASWWQGPGQWSREFTRLSTGGVFNPSALLQEISVARGEVNTKIDELALDMLATWAMSRHDAEVK